MLQAAKYYNARGAPVALLIRITILTPRRRKSEQKHTGLVQSTGIRQYNVRLELLQTMRRM